jgi:tripartite-type tricarboxylate transporter receptor subunit TctC
MTTQHRFHRSAIALLFGAMASWSMAQPYPSKPITLVVPNPPGGFVDASARILSDSLAKVSGQAIVVDNRGGGSGNVAYQAVARAAPDGYTLLNSYSAYHVGNPNLTPKLPWAQKDFVPVALITVATNVITVHPSVPANNLSEFVSYLKKIPASSKAWRWPARAATRVFRACLRLPKLA